MRVSRVLVCIASSSLLAAAGCGGGGAPAGAEPLGTSSSALSTTCPTVGPLGSPRHDAVAVTAPEDCLGGTSDSLGNIGLGWNHSPTQTNFHVFTPGNAPLGTFAFGGKGVQPLGMHSGYEALDAALGGSLTDVTHTGTLGGTSPVPITGTGDQRHLALDYGGGSLAVDGTTSNTGNHFFTIHAQRFSSTGHPRSAAAFVDTMHSAPAFVIGAVSLAGHTLVLWDGAVEGMGGDHVAARWLDRNGVPLTDTFDAGHATGASDPTMSHYATPLFDGSIAFRTAWWALRIPDASTATTPAPSWIANGGELMLLAGGRGYAQFGDGGIGFHSCQQGVRVYAPAGNFCGEVNLDWSSSVGCRTGRVDVGRDGTVIQEYPKYGFNQACTGSTCLCRHRFWPTLIH